MKNKSIACVLDNKDELAGFRKRSKFDSIVTKLRTEKSKYNRIHQKILNYLKS